MDEVEKVLKKIRDKDCISMLLAVTNRKERARRLMNFFPETSSWELKTIEDLFEKMESYFRKQVVTDNL